MEHNKETRFETAMERLETILKQLEQGNIPLEESLTLFEEGIRLANYCTKKLDEAEGKIKLLIEQADGTLLEKDFDLGEE